MRVDNQHILGVQKIYNQQKKAAGPEKSLRTQAAGDGVNLSLEAKLWSAAIKALNDLPGTSAQKIQELKIAVKAGTYQVSNEDIVDRIIQENMLNK